MFCQRDRMWELIRETFDGQIRSTVETALLWECDEGFREELRNPAGVRSSLCDTQALHMKPILGVHTLWRPHSIYRVIQSLFLPRLSNIRRGRPEWLLESGSQVAPGSKTSYCSRGSQSHRGIRRIESTITVYQSPVFSCKSLDRCWLEVSSFPVPYTGTLVSHTSQLPSTMR
jgi:hypothetical protein